MPVYKDYSRIIPKLSRRPHKLKENKRNSVPRYIIAIDTETYQEQIEEDTFLHKLKLGWAIYKDLQTQKEEYFYFEKVQEFWEWLKSKLYNKKHYYIFAHNFDFDFQVIEGWKYLSEYLKAEIKKFIVDSNRFYIKAKVPLSNDFKQYASLSFISTTNYTNYPLKKLGKILGLEKMEIEFDSADKEYLKEYCKRDTEIVLKFVEYLIKFIKEHNLGNFKPTIASQAFTAFRHRFMKKPIYIHSNREAQILERMSYRGGRTEAWFIGKVKETIYKLDINSMYPYVMRNFTYPTKLVRVLHDISPEYLDILMRDFLVIAEVYIEVTKPVIGVKKEKLIFPVGRFWAILTNPELNLVKKYGKILKVRRVAIYEHDYIFREYVDYFYNLRLKFKEEGNEVMQYFAKIMLNSLYGKFGQKNEHFRKIKSLKSDHWEILKFYDADEQRWKYIQVRAGEVYVKDGYIESENSFVAIASYVTAYARCYLWELIEKAGEENVYYMDTDSLFVTQKGYENLKEYINDKELGKLKLEGVSDNVIIKNVKDYIFGNEVKRKGIRKDAEEIAPNTFKQIQFVKIRSNLKDYKVNGVIMKYVTKSIKSTYDKGIVMPNGRVKPLVLYEDENQSPIDQFIVS